MSESWRDAWTPADERSPLEYALPIGYLPEIVDDAYYVLRELSINADDNWYLAIAARLELSSKYVHLILELLLHAGLTECGTSPRGSWITDDGRELLRAAEAYHE